jgi:hypothetical protein
LLQATCSDPASDIEERCVANAGFADVCNAAPPAEQSFAIVALIQIKPLFLATNTAVLLRRATELDPPQCRPNRRFYHASAGEPVMPLVLGMLLLLILCYLLLGALVRFSAGIIRR